MLRHQFGIFAEGTRSQHHLELSLRDGVADADLAAALGRVRSAGEDHRTNGFVNLVVGLAPALAERLGIGAPRVRSLRSRATPTRARLHAPATQRDLWVWIHGPSTDVVIDVARAAVAALRPVATVELDLPCFVYRDSRDLTGFVDGSANPFLDRAPQVALVPDGAPGEGGAFALTMQFRHDLDAFGHLDPDDQERVFGRTKLDSVELRGDAKPPNAHISRVEVDGDDGEELKVYRRSVSWATAEQQGLHFVAFGPDLDRFDVQLRHMYGLVDDRITDRLLDFTTPLTGSFWFCPSIDDLERAAPVADHEG